MNVLYLAALAVSSAGLLALDARLRLAVFRFPRRAAVVLAIAIAGFLAWDLAGIALGIFFEGNRALLVGVDLAPELPLEEVFFLLLLTLTALEAFAVTARLLERRDGVR
ncbi:lycopene cyclase domain-containing protein [Amnibacterium sp. CER49]|uniref:lycopene cyclase domain-containing protein n=1 Tax=Amnibacterium sp. CER49 TaxID=3039161 RepID=UPI002449CEDB|nr:lycopene cyclase domain-containing protein [Amnibacterium sp. CER49]MDH2443671.1 lycopene cyclase domain-containing protein [Amnibacterium sp. CER49]